MENDIVLGEKMVNKKENVFKEAYSIYNTVLAVINGRKLYVFCMVFVVVSGGGGSADNLRCHKEPGRHKIEFPKQNKTK